MLARSLRPPCQIVSRRLRGFSNTSRRSDDAALKNLLSKFMNPDSPYYIKPGTVGPSSPENLIPSGTGAGDKLEEARDAGRRYFQDEGYDTRGMLEWPVAWGDCDMFQHANNVQFVRWFESARVRYAQDFGSELPEGVMTTMLRGKGTGFILKEVSIRYRLPVTWPDTLLIANKPHNINQSRACFSLGGAFWSLKESKLVATGDSTMVMYDYDNLRKGTMSDEFYNVLKSRTSTR